MKFTKKFFNKKNNSKNSSNKPLHYPNNKRNPYKNSLLQLYKNKNNFSMKVFSQKISNTQKYNPYYERPNTNYKK